MAIAIDIKSALGNKTGKGVYAYNMVREMLKEKKHRFFLYSTVEHTHFSAAPVPSFEVSPSPDPILEEFRHCENATLLTFPSGPLWHLRVFWDVIRRARSGEISAYFSPSSFIVPALLVKFKVWFLSKGTTLRVLVTVHDLIAVNYGATHEKKAVWIERCTLPTVLHGADKIFAVSENTKKDVCERFHTNPDKVVITHNAVGELFKKNTHPDPLALNAFREKYHLPPHFVLSLGTLVPRKNIGLTLSAFKLLQDGEKTRDLHLVIVGGGGWDRKEAARDPRVHVLGYIPYDELPLVYACAELFVYPSFYEGFGLPPLEAQAMSCPVITSNTSSLPEVVGDSAIMVDPHDAVALRDAILLVYTDELLRKELIRKGLKNVERFSWVTSAHRALALL